MRPSMRTNTPSRATPAPMSSRVAVSPQPVWSVRTMPRTSSESPIVAARAPAQVELVGPRGVAALHQQPLRGHRGDQPDGNVDEEDPAPGEQVGDDAAQQHAGGTAGAAHGAPDADRAVARRALGEGGRENRQRCRRDHGTAEALHGASRDQQPLAVGEPAGQRGEREQGQAGDEHAASAQEVGCAAAEQQEAGEGHGVGVDDPLQVDLGEAEGVPDRGQRHVDDRHVEDDHELRQARQQQRRAQMRRGG